MIKTLFQRRLFLLLLFVFAIVFFLAGGFSGNYSINKTVGWAWDVSNFQNYSKVLLPIFLVGYGIMALMKRPTTFLWSVLHFVIIVIDLIMVKTLQDPLVVSLLMVASLALFILNLFFSLKRVH